MQKAYHDWKAGRRTYQDECYGFAATIRNGLVAYSGCPDKNIEFFPPSKGFDADAQPKTFFTQAGAMEIADDGFWRLGVALLLTPTRAVLHYIINLKKVSNRFLLKLEGFEKEFDAGEDNEAALQPFFEFMISIAVENYRDGLRQFVEQDSRKPIGFTATAREDRMAKSA